MHNLIVQETPMQGREWGSGRPTDALVQNPALLEQ